MLILSPKFSDHPYNYIYLKHRWQKTDSNQQYCYTDEILLHISERQDEIVCVHTLDFIP